MKKITLYCREGNSDKVYQAAIEPKDGGYVVTFAYGRRGTMLTTGTKTPTAVEEEEAARIYDKLVNSKKAKGYTEAKTAQPTRPAMNPTETAGSVVSCSIPF